MATDRAWKCDVCGYVHRGEEPPLECPVCGAPRDMFSPLDLGMSQTPEPRPVAPSATPPPPPARAPTRWVCTVCGYVHEGLEPPASCPDCSVGPEFFERQRDSAVSAAPVKAPPSGPSIVVVGAGIAGVTAAEQARLSNPAARITLVSREPGYPYYRLNMTRALAEGWAAQQLEMHGAAWFAERSIELIEGEVVAIHRPAHKVELSSGKELAYDALILASGAHAFIPPIAGAGREGVFALRRLRDLQSVGALARPLRKAVCLGGGLLGLEISAGLAKRGVSVTVVETMSWLLPRQLAKPAGDLLLANLESLGVRVVLDGQVAQITGDETARGVLLKDGRELEADFVLLATGIRPNSHLARKAGLEVKQGVVVDDQLRTSDPAIWAAGDLAEHRSVLYGIWPASYAQGAIAGANAAGESRTFSGLPPATAIKVLSVGVFSVGQFEPRDGADLVFEHADGQNYVRLVVRGGKLVGANLYGDVKHAPVLKTAVEKQESLSTLAVALEAIPGAGAFCEANKG